VVDVEARETAARAKQATMHALRCLRRAYARPHRRCEKRGSKTCKASMASLCVHHRVDTVRQVCLTVMRNHMRGNGKVPAVGGEADTL
jgi:hypothetical protein